MAACSTYLVALGSNRRSIYGSPRATLGAAMARVGGVLAFSPIVETPPLGPSRRRFANAVMRIESDETPPALLARLKAAERAFGRRGGRQWGARVLDLDIVLWSGGRWRARTLEVPHPAFRERGFVLAPLVELAPGWRDPVTGLTIRQLVARRAKVDRAPKRP